MWNSSIDNYTRSILTAILLVGTGIAHAALPVGIPDPAGKVPAAIMPDLPTAGSQINAFPYDPINIPSPQWSNGAKQYYIDSNASNCSDTSNSGRGNPSTPRCTLPGMDGGNWKLSAGDQLFIVGDGASYGGNRHMENADMMGTADNPIWIVGLGSKRPEFNFQRFVWTQGRHVFFDSVHFASPGDDFRMIFYRNTGPVEYFTFRHLGCSGSDGTHSSSSRRCFSIGGSEQNIAKFIVFYDVDIWGLGRWQDDRRTSTDLHGMQLQKWTRYVWLLNSRIYHVQGDSIQCGNSNWWDYNRKARPHYFYVGGNEFYEDYENGYDQKGCYHLVFSGNHVHDFYNSYKGANETAITPEQDSEGDVGGYFTWFINNLVENVGTAFGPKATTDDAYIYILGNVVRNAKHSAMSFTQRCFSGGSAGRTCPRGLTFANNTIDGNLKGVAISNPQNPVNSQQTVEIDSNIFYNCANGTEDTDVNWESFSVDPLYIKHLNNVHYRTSGGNISLLTNRIDEYSGNILNQDVRISPDNGEYNLLEGSPAANLVKKQNPAYSLFESMYGLSIRQDRFGNTWNAGSTINAGANQGGVVPGTIKARPSAPVLQ